VLYFWRYVSLASIAASAAMPLLIYILWAPHHAPPFIMTFGALAAAMVIIYKHDANIQRLVQGEESKFYLWKKRKTQNEQDRDSRGGSWERLLPSCFAIAPQARYLAVGP